MLRQCVLRSSPAVPTTADYAAKLDIAMSPSMLYRQLLKLYLRRFDTDVETIVKAWRQTRFEFESNRGVSAEDAAAYIVRGQQILHVIRSTIVPLCVDERTGRKFARYDKELLEATNGVVDPISPEEFIRKYHDKMNAEDVTAIKAMLKQTGRWEGNDELRPEDLHKIKTKRRRTKCTDPEPIDDEASTVTPAKDAAPTPEK
jgi:hypothetical protein